jgi:predicted phosphodiesterase
MTPTFEIRWSNKCGNMNAKADMRVAVLADIHGNLPAFEAVLADIRKASPDLVLHGGDLADGGSSPVEIVDWIRDLGWDGVMGNTDEMLVRPDSLEHFAKGSSAPLNLWVAIREIAAATCGKLGEERLTWMRQLPRIAAGPGFAVVHASPEDCWRTPAENASDAELAAIYGSLNRPIVVFGHTHRPAVRSVIGCPELLINTGSVGLPHDGDPRASYLLLDSGTPSIRRVEYSVEKELNALLSCGLPGAEWTARMLRTSFPQMP